PHVSTGPPPARVPECVGPAGGAAREPLVLVRPHRDHDLRIRLLLDRAAEPMQEDLDQVVAMSVDAGRAGKRRCLRRAGASPRCRRAATVVAMAREADLGIYGGAPIQRASLLPPH